MALILKMEDEGREIKNFDLEPIPYFDPIKNKDRKYYPDFIVDNTLICEVKWLGFIYDKKKEEIKSKRKQLEIFCEANGMSSDFVTNKDIPKKYLDKAVKIHKGKK